MKVKLENISEINLTIRVEFSFSTSFDTIVLNNFSKNTAQRQAPKQFCENHVRGVFDK